MQCQGARSLANDLNTGQGVVSSRAAFILRSVETRPLIGRFVFILFFFGLVFFLTKNRSFAVLTFFVDLYFFRKKTGVHDQNGIFAFIVDLFFFSQKTGVHDQNGIFAFFVFFHCLDFTLQN